MPPVHLGSGRPQSPPPRPQQPTYQQQTLPGQAQTGQTVQQNYAPPSKTIMVQVAPGEIVASFLINGGIILVMSLVLYFGWNFGLLGIGGIIRQNLYHQWWYWTFNKTYDLNIGVHHLIPLIVSLIHWRFLPYDFYPTKYGIGRVRVYWFERRPDATALQLWVWWINLIVLDVGTTYGGVEKFFVQGVTLPLPGIRLVLATTGAILMLQALIVAIAFALAPEPVIKSAAKQFWKDIGR